MKRIDPRPSLTPTLDEQRDALRKGLGRAVQWAFAGTLEDAPLLEACTQNLVYDTQIDGLRTEWLWRLIEIADGAERFRDAIHTALTPPTERDDIAQLVGLAYHYAARGHEEFRSILYALVEHNPFPNDWPGLAEEEIVRLDGAEGFLFAVRIRGAQLADRKWEWDDHWLGEHAIKQLGREKVAFLLEEGKDASVRRYYAGWLRDQQEKEERGRLPKSERGKDAYVARMKRIPFDKVVEDIQGTTNMKYILRGWGAHASDEHLRTVLDLLWSAESPAVSINALAVFAKRPLPTFDPRLIDLCTHADEDVRGQAFSALAMNTHPLVRAFALSRIQAPLHPTTVGLFIQNYERGDEDLLVKALELPNDVDDIHWLMGEILEMLEENEEADPSALGLIIYANTPCQQCRVRAVRLLRDRTTLPDWMPDECRYDAEEECRKLFNETSETDPQNDR